MADYLLIESRDPFASNDVANYYELAADLVSEGNDVVLFLVENGVLPARAGARSDPLSALLRSGVKVLADDFALRERGIAADRLCEECEPRSSPSPTPRQSRSPEPPVSRSVC